MGIKKFRLFLPSDVEKEEKWLTDMSKQGYQFYKYGFFIYYFEEDRSHSYVYQIDFNTADEDYFQLFEDAGWQHVESVIQSFHYFRTDPDQADIRKLYSDKESVKETYQRMLHFYLIFFAMLIVLLLGNIALWKGYAMQIFTTSFVSAVLILYIYLFFALKRKIKYYQ